MRREVDIVYLVAVHGFRVQRFRVQGSEVEIQNCMIADCGMLIGD